MVAMAAPDIREGRPAADFFSDVGVAAIAASEAGGRMSVDADGDAAESEVYVSY